MARAGQPVPEWAGDQAVEQAADLTGGQRDGPWNVGVVPGIGRRWGRRGGSAGSRGAVQVAAAVIVTPRDERRRVPHGVLQVTQAGPASKFSAAAVRRRN